VSRPDPVTVAVIGGALQSIATEMGHKLAHMSYSSIIRESEDFGCVLCDPAGRQLSESPQSTPLQSGPIPGYIRGINRRFAELGDEWRPGDVVAHNHAYYGASHQPDVAFAVPIHHRDRLVGFSVTTAHHLDLGASSPGTIGVNAVDAYAEGLQLNAVKVEEGGRRNEAIWRLLHDNIRAPSLVLADMEAQIAAARIGAARHVHLLDRFGPEIVELACAELMDNSERLLRRQIEELADGTYRATGYLDGYEDDPDPQCRDVKIEVALTVSGSDITVDFTGSSGQVARPINMPLEGTVDVAVALTLRSILLDSAVHGPVPTNSGLFRPISIVAPRGSIVNPEFPAPTIARAGGGNVVADTVMRAMAAVAPDRVSAGTGNLRAVTFSGIRDGSQWVYIDIHEGSYGGRLGKDGLDAVDTLYANTRNNPIEDIEAHHPLRVTRYELDAEAPGRGQWRGGIGSIREFEFLEDSAFAVEGEGLRHDPPGLFGGEPGRAGRIVLEAGGEITALSSKVPYRPGAAGTRLRLLGPSAGGYGDPAARDPVCAESDHLDGYRLDPE
jgi:N-methylhydantoinase B